MKPAASLHTTLIVSCAGNKLILPKKYDKLIFFNMFESLPMAAIGVKYIINSRDFL